MLRKEIVEFPRIKLPDGSELDFYRIAVLGKKGNGKTTLVNTFNSAAHRAYAEFGTTGKDVFSVTAAIGALHVRGAKGLWPISLYDSFGWDDRNYLSLLAQFLRTTAADSAKDPKLMEIINQRSGVAAPVANPGGVANADPNQPEQDFSSLDYVIGIDPSAPLRAKDSKHGAILTVRAVDVSNVGVMQKLNLQALAVSRTSGLPMLLAITHVDYQDVDLRVAENPYKLLDSSIITDVMARIHKETQIPLESMRIVLPYKPGSDNHPVKDFLIFSLIRDILNMAKNSIESRANREADAHNPSRGIDEIIEEDSEDDEEVTDDVETFEAAYKQSLDVKA